MKIEFLDDINDGGNFLYAGPNQLVRIYDFDSLQANKLRQTIQKIINDSSNEINLTTLEFVEAFNCNLTLKVSDTNRGITTVDKENFDCNLTVEKYEEIIFLIEPFCDKEANGYQWLYDLDTPIDFLFSPGGFW